MATLTSQELTDSTKTLLKNSSSSSSFSPTPSWKNSPPSSPRSSSTTAHVTRADSDEIFVDMLDSSLSLTPTSRLSKPASASGDRSQCVPSVTRGHSSASATRSSSSASATRSSSSASSLSKSSSLASISEEEVMSMMESMGEKEMMHCMPPCECDLCLFQEPESRKETHGLRRQSSWKKIRGFIHWSPFIQVFKKQRYPWVQLAGHQGNFQAGDSGSVLKKQDSREQECYVKLMTDVLKNFIPEYRGSVEKNGETFLQLQDLLGSFSHPCVMDIKMGVRTFLEDEIRKARRSPTLRKDMYQKMIEVDKTAPTTEENENKAVSKPRYMQWRDEMSSSVELGFRVEGVKRSNGNSSKDFKKIKSRDSITEVLSSFVGANESVVVKYLTRLQDLRSTLEVSEFFASHEVIGSSLLFVHDADENVGVWMIDFGKTEPLPDAVVTDHRSPWKEGNHEDGYLLGLDNVISILEDIQGSLTSS